LRKVFRAVGKRENHICNESQLLLLLVELEASLEAPGFAIHWHMPLSSQQEQLLLSILYKFKSPRNVPHLAATTRVDRVNLPYQPEDRTVDGNVALSEYRAKIRLQQ